MTDGDGNIVGTLINIVMANTYVKELHIIDDRQYDSYDFDERIESILLLSIVLEGDGQAPRSFYYLNSRDDDEGIAEIKSGRYISLLNILQPEKITVIELVFKSIDLMVFSAGEHDFRIEFQHNSTIF